MKRKPLSDAPRVDLSRVDIGGWMAERAPEPDVHYATSATYHLLVSTEELERQRVAHEASSLAWRLDF